MLERFTTLSTKDMIISLRKYQIIMKQNASYICHHYNILYLQCKYICCYTCHISRICEKTSLRIIVVEENADSIIHMDNHIAKSHSEL